MSERLSPLCLSGSKPAANVHRWNPTRCHLFFVRFPTAANKRAAGCIQSNDPVFFKEPVCAAKIPLVVSFTLAAEVWPARKRPLEREDVLRQTLNQGCVATWQKSELRNCFETANSYSYSYSLLHPIARASVKDERRNRHDKTGTISKILCACKLNHWQDRRYSLTEASDLRLSMGTEFKTEKQK